MRLVSASTVDVRKRCEGFLNFGKDIVRLNFVCGMQTVTSDVLRSGDKRLRR